MSDLKSKLAGWDFCQKQKKHTHFSVLFYLVFVYPRQSEAKTEKKCGVEFVFLRCTLAVCEKKKGKYMLYRHL